MKQQLINDLREQYKVYFTDSSGPESFAHKDITADPLPLIHLHSRQMLMDNPTVIGTLFAKRYAKTAAGHFYALVHGCILQTDPAHAFIRAKNYGELALELPSGSWVESSDQKLQREAVHALIKHHIEPLFFSISKHTGARSAHLFSIASHTLHQTSLHLKEQMPHAASYVEDILHMYTAYENFSTEFRFKEHSGFYVRKHCCLSYMLDGDKASCCKTCPLINKKRSSLST
ncbi:hypothetical protein [Alkalicoccus halolimnae]|uniref:Ferric siderophore reductase C-terminal domain-containing protein n=1 Tax=Alkalicoccus halolimnae TaxID=1667239 RepID=A0A5C7FHG6_9BACI|nr:hypothetical protein [Alkalicoccus halolimnae]TXF83248.1 hypothetical protein FTX54_12755 [Alkalicoccus halolimnae]